MWNYIITKKCQGLKGSDLNLKVRVIYVKIYHCTICEGHLHVCLCSTYVFPSYDNSAADDLENFLNWMDNLWLKVENIVSEGEIACYVFKKPSTAEASEASIWGKGLTLSNT